MSNTQLSAGEIKANLDLTKYEKLYHLMQEEIKEMSVADQAMNHAAFIAVNATYGQNIDPTKVKEMYNRLQSAYYFLEQLEEHGVINKSLMEEIDATLSTARIK